MKNGWVGFDLDGTLAKDMPDFHPTAIGPPIPEMLDRVKLYLLNGITVKIFTARVANDPDDMARKAIQLWCLEHIGVILPITCCKDYQTWLIYDDRAVSVEKDTGKLLINEANIRKHEKE